MSKPKSVFDSPRLSSAAARAVPPNTRGKKGKFAVAAAGREIMDEHAYMWWLREVMAGRDPDAKLDKDGNPTVSPGGFVKLPEWKDRMKAAQEFGNRMLGQAPQSVVVEEHLRVSGRIEHAELLPSKIAQMDPERKANLRSLLAAAVRGDLVPARNERPALPVVAAEARDANPDPAVGSD